MVHVFALFWEEFCISMQIDLQQNFTGGQLTWGCYPSMFLSTESRAELLQPFLLLHAAGTSLLNGRMGTSSISLRAEHTEQAVPTGIWRPTFQMALNSLPLSPFLNKLN